MTSNLGGARSQNLGHIKNVFFSAFLRMKHIIEGLDGGGSGIHYSLKIEPIIHLIKILGYSLK